MHEQLAAQAKLSAWPGRFCIHLQIQRVLRQQRCMLRRCR
jgi:hypothetical protein